MSRKYPGGLIRKTPPTITPPVDGEGGSAPGVWTLNQASYYIKQGTWPLPTLPRALYSWGNSFYGESGHNDTVKRSSPTQIGALTDWNALGAAVSSSFAVKTDGTLWAWGLGSNGELGISVAGPGVYRSSPVQIGALTNWSSVTGGNNSAWAIKTDSTLWGWGQNQFGAIGDGTANPKSSPVQIGSLTNWSKVSGMDYGFIALKTDGTLWTCGFNNAGQLGQNNTISRSSPVQVGALTTWSSIGGSASFWIATQTNGTLWACGQNSDGQLGNTSVNSASSPVQVGALTNWSRVGPLRERTSFAIKTDGTLWGWGRNGWGQVGDGTTTYRSSPVQIGALTTWLNVGGGQYFALATKTDGTLWAWGINNNGQLGQNNVAPKSSPVQIGSGTDWYTFSAGNNTPLAITRG